MTKIKYYQAALSKNYDLTVDGPVGVEACAEVICEYIKHKTVEPAQSEVEEPQASEA